MKRTVIIFLSIIPLLAAAQEPDRGQVLADDIHRLGERAVRDRVISEEEHREMISFVRDSLPEGTNLKIKWNLDME